MTLIDYFDQYQFWHRPTQCGFSYWFQKNNYGLHEMLGIQVAMVAKIYLKPRELS